MLDNKISLWSAILININLMVGAGIYFMPPLMAREAGSWSFLGWPLCSILFVPVVLSIAHISRLLPGEGSFYTYSRVGINQTFGFVAGWMYFLGYVAIGALQLLALQNELAVGVGFTTLTQYSLLFAGVVIGSLCLLNVFNLRIIGKIQGYITIFKLLPLVFIALLLIPLLNPTNIVASGVDTISRVSLTIPLALFGFWGFESCASLSHRIGGDKRNASRAILIGFFATVLIYTIVHLSLISIMGADALAQIGVSGFVNALGITSPLLARFVDTLIEASIITAYINAIFGSLTANSFLLLAMAREKMLYGAHLLARTNRHDQPIVAVTVQGILLVTFAWFISQKASLAAIANLGMLAAFIITLCALLRLQLRERLTPRITVTVLGFFSCAIMIYYSVREITEITYLLPLIIATAVGLTLYALRSFSKATK